MTKKQKMFANEYLIDLNATRAYLLGDFFCSESSKNNCKLTLAYQV